MGDAVRGKASDTRKPWHADERRLWIWRMRKMLIGDSIDFPCGYRVRRAEYSYVLYQGSVKLNLTDVLGGNPIPDRDQRITKIVDWILERSTPMDMPDVPPSGRTGGAKRSTVPVANGRVSPGGALCLDLIAKAGGEVPTTALANVHLLTLTKLRLEGLIEDSREGYVALTPAGVARCEARRQPAAPAPKRGKASQEEETPLHPPVRGDAEAALAASEFIAYPLVPVSPPNEGCTCENCASRRMLEMLMQHSPAVREAVEYLVGLDAALARIRGL